MTVGDALVLGIKSLSQTAGCRDSAALDAELLLGHALGFSREELCTRGGKPIPTAARSRYRAYLARRRRHEPVAYIVGYKDFYRLRLVVKKGACLIPRPKTEVLVERAIELLGQSPATASRSAVLDIGTGSGAIAIAVAKNVSGVKIVATDVSGQALAVAGKNAKLHGVARRIAFKKTDLLPAGLPRNKRLLILANLPYGPSRVWRTLAPDVRFEPKISIIGGRDGLDRYRRLVGALAKLEPRVRFTLLAEIREEQYAPLAKLIGGRWPKARISRHQDGAEKIRVLEAEV
jgi:release factor glutamine methyltransferase